MKHEHEYKVVTPDDIEIPAGMVERISKIDVRGPFPSYCRLVIAEVLAWQANYIPVPTDEQAADLNTRFLDGFASSFPPIRRLIVHWIHGMYLNPEYIRRTDNERNQLLWKTSGELVGPILVELHNAEILKAIELGKRIAREEDACRADRPS